MAEKPMMARGTGTRQWHVWEGESIIFHGPKAACREFLLAHENAQLRAKIATLEDVVKMANNNCLQMEKKLFDLAALGSVPLPEEVRGMCERLLRRNMPGDNWTVTEAGRELGLHNGLLVNPDGPAAATLLETLSRRTVPVGDVERAREEMEQCLQESTAEASGCEVSAGEATGYRNALAILSRVGAQPAAEGER